MKRLPARNLILFVALLLGLAAVALGILSLPWVKPDESVAPRLDVIARGSAPLSAGVGVAPIDVPLGAPIAGFPHLGYRSDGADPVTARALVLGEGELKVAVVSAEILLVPDSLRAAVLARLRPLQLSGIILGATHTHASPGGYYDNLVAERAALGPYDPAMRDRIANAMAEAVRRALASEGPARLSVGRGRDASLVGGRDGAPPDGRLTVLRVDRDGGVPVAELTIFASHATTLGIHNRVISGDWPSRFYAHGKHGVRLLLQGAVGDQSPSLPRSFGPLTAENYGASVDQAVEALGFGPPDPAPPIAFAAADVTLPVPVPSIAPRLLHQAATNLASAFLPSQARVSALRIGPVLLLDVPGEVLSEVAVRLEKMAGPGAVIVSLTDGYVGYVDGGERSGQEQRHPERFYYGPKLAPALERGLSMTVGALRQASAPAPGRGTGAAGAPVSPAAVEAAGQERREP